MTDQNQANLIFEFYNTKLTDAEREDFDKTVGINRWASPEVGEGYTISSGGASEPGKRTWNFHWAGVVMKGGDDTVTLENYAVGDASVQNQEWVYQMYGSAKDKGQTFHELPIAQITKRICYCPVYSQLTPLSWMKNHDPPKPS